jgi:hypothetical protein
MGGVKTRKVEMRGAYIFWWVNTRQRGHFEDVNVGGRIILKWIFKKSVGRAWIGLINQNEDMWPAVVKTVINFGFL